MVNFVQKLLGNCSCERLVQTRLDAFRRLVGDFDGLLQQSERELGVLFAGNPKSKIVMDDYIRHDNAFDFLHEFKT